MVPGGRLRFSRERLQLLETTIDLLTDYVDKVGHARRH
jgi:hypothetical protein